MTSPPVYQSSFMTNIAAAAPPEIGSGRRSLSSHGSGGRRGPSLYGRLNPGQAFADYWMWFEADQASRSSLRSQNFDEYQRQLSEFTISPQPQQVFQSSRPLRPPPRPSSYESTPPQAREYQDAPPLHYPTGSSLVGDIANSAEPAFLSTLVNDLRTAPTSDEHEHTQALAAAPTNWISAGDVDIGSEMEQILTQMHSNIHSSEGPKEQAALPMFERILSAPRVDITELCLLIQQEECVPPEKRALVWQLLLGLLPPDRAQWGSVLRKKRTDYFVSVIQHYVPDRHEGTTRGTLDYQVRMDVHRTHPFGFNRFIALPEVSAALSRILFTWSKANAGIDYFQGLNELASLLLLVFATSAFGPIGDFEGQSEKNEKLSNQLTTLLPHVEADTYWALSSIMNTLNTTFSFTSGGLHAEPMLTKFEALLKQCNPELERYLQEKNNIPLAQFAFRWMLCLFARESTPRNVLSLWDQYWADLQGFPIFHIYFCAAFLQELSQIFLPIEDDMERVMYVLHQPPTRYWDENNFRPLIWTARQLRSEFPLS